jgi:hypothetical protein
VTRIVKGFPRGSWEKEPGRRTEALDCRVYARAAAAIYGLDRFEERHWRRMEEALALTVKRDDDDGCLPELIRAPPGGDSQRFHGALTWHRRRPARLEALAAGQRRRASPRWPLWRLHGGSPAPRRPERELQRRRDA